MSLNGIANMGSSISDKASAWASAMGDHYVMRYALVLYTLVAFVTICVLGVLVYEGACVQLEEDGGAIGMNLMKNIGPFDKITAASGVGVAAGGVLVLGNDLLVGALGKAFSKEKAVPYEVNRVMMVLLVSIPVMMYAVAQWQIQSIECKYPSIASDCGSKDKATGGIVSCSKNSMNQWSSISVSKDKFSEDCPSKPAFMDDPVSPIPSKTIAAYKIWKMVQAGGVGFPIGMLATMTLLWIFQGIEAIFSKIQNAEVKMAKYCAYAFGFGAISLIAAAFACRYYWVNMMCLNKGGFQYDYLYNTEECDGKDPTKQKTGISFGESKGFQWPWNMKDGFTFKPPQSCSSNGTKCKLDLKNSCSARDEEARKNAKTWQIVLGVLIGVFLLFTVLGIGGGIALIAVEV